MSNQNPIGLFDSGIGGTSIWKEIKQLLPNENTIYLADSANAPYGKRSKQEIIQLCFKNIDYLVSQNCKMIVVACNTATTNAIAEIRTKYKIPIIGIEPAIKPAANQTETYKIGILATQGTLNSELFNRQIKSYTNIKIIEQVGHNLVELIENGEINTPKMTELLSSYLCPMVQENVDFIVLGCSHYPYLIPKIKEIIPSNIQIIDSGEAVAKQTKTILMQYNLLNTSKKIAIHTFYTNVNPIVLQNILGFSENVFQKNF